MVCECGVKWSCFGTRVGHHDSYVIKSVWTWREMGMQEEHPSLQHHLRMMWCPGMEVGGGFGWWWEKCWGFGDFSSGTQCWNCEGRKERSEVQISVSPIKLTILIRGSVSVHTKTFDQIFILKKARGRGKFVYYESIKRELNKRLIFEWRCDARLKSKDEGSTRLSYTRWREEP